MELENNRLLLNQVALGKELPNWSIEGVFDDSVPEVQDFRGTPLLILFFNLSCPGCLGRAIPYANGLIVDEKININVVGIHSNFNGADFSAEEFAKAQKEFYIRFPIFRDANFDTTFLNFGAGGSPHWILIDADGIVRYSIFGSDPNNALLRLDYMIDILQNEQGTL